MSNIVFNNKETGELIIKLPVIETNPHGVENGWCTYPVNFDPIWINYCMVQQPKDDTKV